MRSMTGFGVGAAQLGSGRLVMELRALNHRYLDVRVRMPVELSEYAFFTEQKARELLTRGRFELAARLDGVSFLTPELSMERARSAYKTLETLRDELAPGTPLPVSVLTSIPALIQTPPPASAEEVQRSIEAALTAAVKALTEMRQAEGKALEEELRTRLSTLRHLHSMIARFAESLIKDHRARLAERVRRISGESAAPLDPARLELEVTLIAERSDVTEELVRLQSHFSQLEALIDDPNAIGRKLDFLLQEVNREVNTVASKCQAANLSHRIVDMKAEIERMREQVQNVE